MPEIADDTFDPSLTFTAGDQTPAPSPAPEVTSVAPEKPPLPDEPFDPSETFRPFYTPDTLLQTSAADLEADRTFNPSAWGAENKDVVDANPLLQQRLLDAYKLKNADFHLVKSLAKRMQSQTPLENVAMPFKSVGGGAWDMAKSMWKGGVQLAKNTKDILGGGLTMLTTGDESKKTDAALKTLKSGLEIAASAETANAGLGNMVRKSLRDIGETVDMIPGSVNKPLKDYTNEEWKKRYDDDVAGHLASQETAKANGVYTSAILGSGDAWKTLGVHVDPNIATTMAPVTDPMNLALMGSGTAAGVITRIGGKWAFREIAQAATKTGASNFVKAGGKLGELGESAVGGTGRSLEALGGGLREKVLKPLGDVGNVAGVMSAVAGAPGLGTGILAGTKLTPKVMELAGRGLQLVAPYLPVGGRIAGDVVEEAFKGYGHGLMFMAPLAIGADEDEMEGLMGIPALGAMTRGGARAGAHGIYGLKVGPGAAAQDYFGKKIFPTKDQTTPPPEVKPYGDTPLDHTSALIEESLDTPKGAEYVGRVDALTKRFDAETAAMDFKKRLTEDQLKARADKRAKLVASVPEVLPVEKNLFNWVKWQFRNAPVEFYLTDEAGMKAQTGSENARGWTSNMGPDVTNADGTVTPGKVRVFFNTDVSSISHEISHVFEHFDPEGHAALVQEVMGRMTPDQTAAFKHVYDYAFNGGKLDPASNPRLLTPEGTANEAVAEVFSRLFKGHDLSSVDPIVRDKVSMWASSMLEKMGIPLFDINWRKRGTPGYSGMGVRPSTEMAKHGDAFIDAMRRRAAEDGGLFGEGSEPASPAPTNVVPIPGPKPTPAGAPGTPAPAPAPAPAPSKPKLTITSPPGEPRVYSGGTPPAEPKLTITSPPGEPRVYSGGTPPAEPAGPKNIRANKAQQDSFQNRRFEETGTESARALAEKLGDPERAAKVDAISKGMEGENPPLEIDYQSVKDDGSPDQPTNRNPRRTAQEQAYIDEALGAVPEETRQLAQKLIVPVRWEEVAGKPQLLAMSLDKVVANAHNLAKQADAVGFKLPYDLQTGGFTPEAWKQFVQDAQDYSANQANGFRGDGKPLVRPTEAQAPGMSIPAENPSYTPVPLSEAKMNFINAAQGLKRPFTSRSPKGKTPGNVKAQILAEVNARKPQVPVNIAPEDIHKQTFKDYGRDIKETNPLRNEMRAAGINTDALIEGTERLSVDNIAKAVARPDINYKAPVTDIIRGGFMPKTAELAKWRDAQAELRGLKDRLENAVDEDAIGNWKTLIEEKQREVDRLSPRGDFQPKVEKLGNEILRDTPDEWAARTSELGGLTGGAFRLGHGLTDAADVAALRDMSTKAKSLYDAAKSAKDIDTMMSAATKQQFFNEALEAATGSSPSKRAAIGNTLGADWKPPFPEVKESQNGIVTTPGPDASGALPGNELAKPDAPIGSIEGPFKLPPEVPRADNTALMLPVEGVDSSVRYAGDTEGLTPGRFQPKVAGDEHTPPSPSYPDADRLARERGGNAWVRQSPDADNSGRVLLVQFTPDLMYPNGPDPISTPYYDKLYSGARPGYARATDFWELPQWVAVATKNLGSKADFYAVRNMAEAKAFMEKSGYGRIAFSVMDVSKALTEELVPHIKGKVDLGGYTDRTGAVKLNPNAKIWDSMNDFVADNGHTYEKGFDYRHFRGTEIIPRLELSAGCRHRCTFCTIERKITNATLPEINAQVDSFKGLNAKYVYGNDKTFGQSPNVAEMPRIYKEMKAANPEFEGFIVQTTAAQMKLFTDEFLQASGIKYVELGVETYNDTILKGLRKPATEKLIDEAVEKLRKNKINFIPNIVIGFPNETTATYGRTMDFLNKHSDIVSHVNTYNLAVYEGTELAKTVKTKTAADIDENSPQKSFHTDPKLHEDFAKQIYEYGNRQLGKETPFKGEFMPDTTKMTAEQAEEQTRTYMDIGHRAYNGLARANPDDRMWVWKDGAVKVAPATENANHDAKWGRSSWRTFKGRYDADKNLLSLVVPDNYKSVTATDQLPIELLDQLHRQFGSNLSVSTFFDDGRVVTKSLKELNNVPVFDPRTVKMGDFMPADQMPDDVDPIVEAAIRTKGGNVFTGSWHGEALNKLVQDANSGKLNEKFTATLNPETSPNAYEKGELTDGFVTKSGKFLTRVEAFKHAEDINQISRKTLDPSMSLRGPASLEATDFTNHRQFMPKAEKIFSRMSKEEKEGTVRRALARGQENGARHVEKLLREQDMLATDFSGLARGEDRPVEPGDLESFGVPPLSTGFEEKRPDLSRYKAVPGAGEKANQLRERLAEYSRDPLNSNGTEPIVGPGWHKVIGDNLTVEDLKPYAWVKKGNKVAFRDRGTPFEDENFLNEAKRVLGSAVKSDEGQFQPKTEAGKEMEKRGIDFVRKGSPINRDVYAKDADGNYIGHVYSVVNPKEPGTAKIVSAFVNPNQQRKGIGEALYRELLTDLKADDIKVVSGNIVGAGALEVRRKIFDKFSKLEVNGEPATLIQARQALQRKPSGLGDFVDAENAIADGGQFMPSVKLTGDEKFQSAEDTGFGNYWLSPDGKFVRVSDHRAFAIERLDPAPKTRDERVNSESVLKGAGWVRISRERGDGPAAVFVNGNKLTQAQESALNVWEKNPSMEGVEIIDTNRIWKGNGQLMPKLNKKADLREQVNDLEKYSRQSIEKRLESVLGEPIAKGLKEHDLWEFEDFGAEVVPDRHVSDYSRDEGPTISTEILRDHGFDSLDLHGSGYFHDPHYRIEPVKGDGGEYPMTDAGVRAAIAEGDKRMVRDFDFSRKSGDFMPKERRPLLPDGTVDGAALFKKNPKDWEKWQDEISKSGESANGVATWPTSVPKPPAQLKPSEPLPNTVGGTLDLIHYSGAVQLEKIDPRFFGRGKATAADLRGGPKSYFFVDGSNMGADSMFEAANAYGVRVDGGAIYDYAKDARKFRSIINREEQDTAIKKAGYAGFKTSTQDGREVVALYKPVETVSLGKRGAEGQAMPDTDADLPGLNLPSEEKAKQMRVKARIAKSQEKFPEALKLGYQKDEAGKFIIGEDGKPKGITVEYGLMDSPLGREAGKGIRDEVQRQTAVATALSKKLYREAKVALKNPEMKAGEKWYSTARTRLKGLFGDDTKLMTELLGATSARTPVETNYRFALDSYNQFKQGKFDTQLKRYRAGKAKWDARNIDDFLAAHPDNQNPNRGQFLDWWVDKYDLSPVQSNGKKFGANSRQVLKVLDGSWAEEMGGPKTPNFAGNLAGTTFEATIDVWAARMLHRLANEGNPKPWRILPENETGVTDKDFYVGQEAYRLAAKELGMKPDALQAVLWFSEKKHWEDRGWTRGAGAALSDFNVLLKDTEKLPGGEIRRKKAQKELAFDLNPSDIIEK